MSDRSANRPVPSEAGFTLIEIIVALALLSLIMGILAGSVKTARNVLAVIEANNTHSAIVPAQSYLRSAFAQTVSAKSALALANQNLRERLACRVHPPTEEPWRS